LVLGRWGNPECDLLIAGDGSGSSWNKPCGWAAVIIDTHSNRRMNLSGGASHGGTLYAELQAFVHAIDWHERIRGDARRMALGKDRLDVLLVTDCLSIVQAGSRIAHGERTPESYASARASWCALWSFSDRHRFSFRHVPRGSIALNVAADAAAGKMRRAIGMRDDCR
jgi:ribonuclease HI